METITVTTKEELKAAQDQKVTEIIVSGELADKVVGAGIVAAPVTGGLSMFAASGAAAITGLEVAAIITASALGIALIIALFKDYEEISFEKGKMTLRKRQA